MLPIVVATAQAQAEKPNFLIVVADDLGWSDIGAYGGEIRTPVLDAMAARGVAMSQFYAAPSCSPTRAMLLTGVDHHQAGLGTMHEMRAPNQQDAKNYEGVLHNGVVTVAEVLREQGYQTMMAGKWHLAKTPDQYPHNRGFDQSFALLQGGASHFADGVALFEGLGADYLENGNKAELPAHFYSTISYTDKLLEYLQNRASGNPFFAYLAYTAPHDPIQVPDEWLDRYKGAYDDGPDVIRERRAQRLKEAGLFPQNAALWQPQTFPNWLPLYQERWGQRSPNQRQQDARPMEIYASMIELLDQQFGRVIDYLDSTGELENTYIIFMSDNGASAATPLMYAAKDRHWFFEHRDNSAQNLGRSGSHSYLGMEWAVVAGAPWKFFKGAVAEGGIRVPFIINGPGINDPSSNNKGMLDSLGHVTDITPTIFSIAGVDPKAETIYTDKLLPQGVSLTSLWNGFSVKPRNVVITELFGSRAIRSGSWKAHLILAPLGSGEWALYDMDSDPAETQDLAETYPGVLHAMVEQYIIYYQEKGIIYPQPPVTVSLKQFHTKECDWWCDFRLEAAQRLLDISMQISDLTKN